MLVGPHRARYLVLILSEKKYVIPSEKHFCAEVLFLSRHLNPKGAYSASLTLKEPTQLP